MVALHLKKPRPVKNPENHNRVALDAKDDPVFPVHKMSVAGAKLFIFPNQGGAVGYGP